MSDLGAWMPLSKCLAIGFALISAFPYLISDEADELEHLVTSQTESVSYDHPNHTVTVTTISDLDLSGTHLLGLPAQEVMPSYFVFSLCCVRNILDSCCLAFQCKIHYQKFWGVYFRICIHFGPLKIP